MNPIKGVAAFLRSYGSETRNVPIQGIVSSEATSAFGPSWSGVVVSQANATRIIAVQAIWGLLADSAGLLPVHVYDREGEGRVQLDDPDWLLAPDPLDPSVTTGEHFSQAVLSMASDGNEFTLALPHVVMPTELRILEPDRIEVKREGRTPVYRYRPEGGGTEILGPDQVIHTPRLRRPGALRGISPIEEAAQALGKTVAADRFGSRVFANGMSIVGALTVPGPLDTQGADQLRDEIEKTYGGGMNANKPGIFGNGATFGYPQTNVEQLQLLEVLRWGVLDVARLYHVPPHLAGDNSPGSVSYASVEQTAIEFVQYAVRPYVERLEASYRRLLPPGQFLSFNIDGLLRGDFKSRIEAIALALQTQQLVLDEARALENRPPLSTMDPAFLAGPGGLLKTVQTRPTESAGSGGQQQQGAAA